MSKIKIGSNQRKILESLLVGYVMLSDFNFLKNRSKSIGVFDQLFLFKIVKLKQREIDRLMSRGFIKISSFTITHNKGLKCKYVLTNYFKDNYKLLEEWESYM